MAETTPDTPENTPRGESIREVPGVHATAIFTKINIETGAIAKGPFTFTQVQNLRVGEAISYINETGQPRHSLRVVDLRDAGNGTYFAEMENESVYKIDIVPEEPQGPPVEPDAKMRHDTDRTIQD